MSLDRVVGRGVREDTRGHVCPNGHVGFLPGGWSCHRSTGEQPRILEVLTRSGLAPAGPGQVVTALGQVLPHLAGGRLLRSVRSAVPLSRAISVAARPG